jgi:ABC-type ATPase involved in cell division
MLDIILLICLSIIIIFNNYLFYFIVFGIFTYFLKQIKKFKKRDKNIFEIDNDIILNKIGPKFKKNRFIIFICSIIFTIIWYIIAEYIGTRYFVFSKKKIIIYSTLALFVVTPLVMDSPILMYFNQLEESSIEKYYDILFYNKIKNINIDKTDNYSKNILIAYLEKLKNIMIIYSSFKYQAYLYLTLIITNIFIIGYFCDFSFVFKLLSCYLLFYIFIYNKYDNQLNHKSKIYMKNVKLKNYGTGYIFSDFRNMIFYNQIKRNSNFEEYLINNSRKVSDNKKDISKDIIIFNYKFNIFKRFLYFATIYYYLSNYNDQISTISITVSILVISYVYNLNGNIYFFLINIVEMLKAKKEYNNGQINNLNNENYNNFLKKVSQKVYINNNDIYINHDKLIKKNVYIKGESGSGKTSILKSLFYFNKKFINKIAYLTQELELEVNNLITKDVISGFEKEINIEYINEALKIACLDKKFNINSIISNISGGEKQRFRIARIIYYILISKSTILIMDEPDNNLDFDIFKQIIFNINNISNIQRIIFTSHKEEIIKYINNLQIIEIKKMK